MKKMSEHRYDIRISDPNPLRVERQDPDNFPRLQTRKRCALEIAAYVFNFLRILQFWHINGSLRCHAMSAFIWKCALNGISRRLVRYFPAPIFCQHKYGSSRTHLRIKLGTHLHIDFWNSEKPCRDIICSTAREN